MQLFLRGHKCSCPALSPALHRLACALCLAICPGLLTLQNAQARAVVLAEVNRPFAVAGAGAMPKSLPPFSLRQDGPEWWLCTPAGRRFFSFGVCCVDRGAGPAAAAAASENPSYSAARHYDSRASWANATVQRLRSWGFNTIGGWGDLPTLRDATNIDFAFTPVLHCGASAGAPWWDMWSERVVRRIDAVAREQMQSVRGDPRIIGYYTDNEMGWWNAALWKMTLEDAPGSGARQRLLRLLRRRYHKDWRRLQQDFAPVDAGSFTELDRRGMLYLRAGGHGIQVMREFLGLMAERYYQCAAEIVHRLDSRALVLGDRYQSFYYPEVARAATRYVDAISSNLNASWNDGTFARFYLDTLYGLTHKPIFVSEFYLCAMENRTGNQNDSGMFPTVDTQRERAAGFARTTAQLLRLPYVVGADWFQYYDEPPKGRYDGENFNMGLVDIRNEPYEELTGQAAALDFLKLKLAPAPARADARTGAPRARRDPLADFAPQSALKHWDRERGFVPPTSAHPLADLYICWDPDAFYVGLYTLDPVEPEYYRDGYVPEADRAELSIRCGAASAPVQIRLGAGRPAAGAPPGITATNISGLKLTVRNVAAVRIPASYFTSGPLAAGKRISFSSTLLTHARANRVDWKTELVLRDP